MCVHVFIIYIYTERGERAAREEKRDKARRGEERRETERQRQRLVWDI